MNWHTYRVLVKFRGKGQTQWQTRGLMVRATSPSAARSDVRLWASNNSYELLNAPELEVAGAKMAGVVMRCPECDWSGDSADVLVVDGYLYGCPECGNGGVR